ncbi:arsenate reductase family protein [Bradyrhizobium sp. CCBAU 45384]|uniref:arsenate reductase family protein n=1 Tax=Bradyrhizobium sp. CCBAU 45384 TaxID=858428 RepID=UPI0023068BBB|nr:arsenate reductase family protein [Bradyrhizobium sp. CCBAU 45384]
MATIIFYRKPGCATNARQIQAPQSAGNDLVVEDILTGRWHADELPSFFRNMPLDACFNRAAPRTRSGEVTLYSVDVANALALIAGDPLLTRRPLIDVDAARRGELD